MTENHKTLHSPRGRVYRAIYPRRKYTHVAYDFIADPAIDTRARYEDVDVLIRLIGDRCFAAGRVADYCSSAGPVYVHFDALNADVPVITGVLDAWVMGNGVPLAELVAQLRSHNYHDWRQRKTMKVAEIRSTPVPALTHVRSRVGVE